jgi:hypothetical protein
LWRLLCTTAPSAHHEPHSVSTLYLALGIYPPVSSKQHVTFPEFTQWQLKKMFQK